MRATPVAVPRPASTVALLRDAAGGVEVWLMRRHTQLAFAAGMQAFPGGAVEDADREPSLPWTGRPVEDIADVLGLDAGETRALVSAAVRETFEECGALVAHGAKGEAEPARVAVLDGSVPWTDVLAAGGLALDGDLLVPWARWITPEFSPRRFDAYFFLARLPDGQQPRWIDGEADQAGWSLAREAVAAHDRGELPMLPPTITTLRSIAEHDTVAEALASAPAHVVTEAG